MWRVRCSHLFKCKTPWDMFISLTNRAIWHLYGLGEKHRVKWGLYKFLLKAPPHCPWLMTCHLFADSVSHAHTDLWLILNRFITIAKSMIHFSRVRSLQPPTNLSTSTLRQGHKSLMGHWFLHKLNEHFHINWCDKWKDTPRRRWGSAAGCRCSEESGGGGWRLRTHGGL